MPGSKEVEVGRVFNEAAEGSRIQDAFNLGKGGGELFESHGLLANRAGNQGLSGLNTRFPKTAEVRGAGRNEFPLDATWT